jgi:hypothetical protein
MDAYRIGHHRQTGCHVLEHFQPAFSLAPGVRRQPTNANIDLGQPKSFRLYRPPIGQNLNPLQMGKLVANDPQG